MRLRHWGFVAAMGPVVPGIISGCSPARAQVAPTDKAANPVHAAPLEVSVYRDDFGMVRQRQAVNLKAGANRVRLVDVSRQLDPNSLTFDAPDRTEVVGSTFDMGIGAGANAIQRLAGREVDLILPSNDGKLGDRLTGIMEPLGDGGFVLRTADRVYINPPGTIAAKDMDGAPTMPGLSVQIQSDGDRSADLGLTYLTQGLSWSADYVAKLDLERSEMRLEAWATVTNGTGVPYPNAQLTFVAGRPNRAVRRQPATASIPADAPVGGVAVDLGRAREMAAAPVGELYEYKVEAPATIGADQSSRVRMFDRAKVPVRLDYAVGLPAIGGWESGGSRVNAKLSVHFDNRAADGLGNPLPSGTFRVYDASDRAARYIGAATIGDVPKDASTALALSDVFDVYVEPKTVVTRRIDRRTVERTIRVRAKNAKTRAIPLRIVQPIYGTWTLVNGPKPDKARGNQPEWTLPIPASSEATLEITVRMRG